MSKTYKNGLFKKKNLYESPKLRFFEKIRTDKSVRVGTLIVPDSGCFVFTDQVACNDNRGAYLVLRVFFCSLVKFIPSGNTDSH